MVQVNILYANKIYEEDAKDHLGGIALSKGINVITPMAIKMINGERKRDKEITIAILQLLFKLINTGVVAVIK